MNLKMIGIIGVDGSGKTTHVKLLLDKLKQKNIPVKYVWFRYFHMLSLVPLLYCRIVGLTVFEKRDDKFYGRHEFYRSKGISLVYPWTLFIDMSITYCIKILIPRYFGYVLVCDRCVYDTIVDLMIDLDDYNFDNSFLGLLFLRLLPRENTKIIFLDVHESFIKERRNELKNDLTLEKRRLAYKKLVYQYNINTLVNEGEVNDVNEKICTLLKF